MKYLSKGEMPPLKVSSVLALAEEYDLTLRDVEKAMDLDRELRGKGKQTTAPEVTAESLVK